MTTTRVSKISAGAVLVDNDKAKVAESVETTKPTKQPRYRRPDKPADAVAQPVSGIDAGVTTVVAENNQLALKRERNRSRPGMMRWSQYYDDLTKS